MKLGKFKGTTYPVYFEFFGHVVTERNVSVYSVETAYEIGYAALAAVDRRGEDRSTCSETKWVIEDPMALIVFMKALNADKMRVGHRVILLLTVSVKNNQLFVRICVSHTEETLAKIDEVPLLSILTNGVFKTHYPNADGEFKPDYPSQIFPSQ